MVMHVKRVSAVIASIVMCAMLVSNAAAFPPETWQDGDEVAVFGHSFEEEYWTNESMNATSPSGDNITFSASFVNYKNVQAFLLALNMVENENGTGTVPFQLFGMHYLTPEGREVFIGAVLAFLLAFDDTYNGTGPGQNASRAHLGAMTRPRWKCRKCRSWEKDTTGSAYSTGTCTPSSRRTS
jgi:hypothetical protein